MTHTSTEQPREKCIACNETGIGKDGWDCLRCDGDGWVFVATAQPDAAPASTEQPEALRLADIVERLNFGVHSQAIAEEYSAAARELRRLHARVQELETIKYAACKAYNTWAYADDIYGEVTKAMHALADAINGITQEKQG